MHVRRDRHRRGLRLLCHQVPPWARGSRGGAPAPRALRLRDVKTGAGQGGARSEHREGRGVCRGQGIARRGEGGARGALLRAGGLWYFWPCSDGLCARMTGPPCIPVLLFLPGALGVMGCRLCKELRHSLFANCATPSRWLCYLSSGLSSYAWRGTHDERGGMCWV
jgi:hypothetical protein